MNGFDHAVLSFFNQWAQRWPEFDELVVIASNSDLIKGGIIMAAVWAAWFLSADTAPTNRSRAYLLSGVAGSLVALFIARILAAVLPARTRPVLTPELHFRAPIGLPDQTNWTTWGSFPSDHAAVFFALAMGVFYVSKRWGIVLFAYVLFAVCLPRLYTGIHYPTDIIAGALLACGTTAVLSIPVFQRLWTRPFFGWLAARPVLFYFAAFLLTFQIATLFWDVRILLNHFGFSS